MGLCGLLYVLRIYSAALQFSPRFGLNDSPVNTCRFEPPATRAYLH